MEIQKIDKIYGKESRNLLKVMGDSTSLGALAALETFYYSFNNKDINALKQVWVNHGLIQLNNPIGGIVRGIDNIISLYQNIFYRNAEIWVEFYDIVSYSSENIVVFVGRERGEFKKGEVVLELEIRTTRFFTFMNGIWGQIHHHGSIDDPVLLLNYQNHVKS